MSAFPPLNAFTASTSAPTSVNSSFGNVFQGGPPQLGHGHHHLAQAPPPYQPQNPPWNRPHQQPLPHVQLTPHAPRPVLQRSRTPDTFGRGRGGGHIARGGFSASVIPPAGHSAPLVGGILSGGEGSGPPPVPVPAPRYGATHVPGHAQSGAVGLLAQPGGGGGAPLLGGPSGWPRGVPQGPPAVLGGEAEVGLLPRPSPEAATAPLLPTPRPAPAMPAKDVVGRAPPTPTPTVFAAPMTQPRTAAPVAAPAAPTLVKSAFAVAPPMPMPSAPASASLFKSSFATAAAPAVSVFARAGPPPPASAFAGGSALQGGLSRSAFHSAAAPPRPARSPARRQEEGSDARGGSGRGSHRTGRSPSSSGRDRESGSAGEDGMDEEYEEHRSDDEDEGHEGRSEGSHGEADEEEEDGSGQYSDGDSAEGDWEDVPVDDEDGFSELDEDSHSTAQAQDAPPPAPAPAPVPRTTSAFMPAPSSTLSGGAGGKRARDGEDTAPVAASKPGTSAFASLNSSGGTTAVGDVHSPPAIRRTEAPSSAFGLPQPRSQHAPPPTQAKAHHHHQHHHHQHHYHPHEQQMTARPPLTAVSRAPHRVDTSRPSRVAQLFEAFLVKLSSDRTREQAWQPMDEAFFGDLLSAHAGGGGSPAVHPDFSYSVDELTMVWRAVAGRERSLAGKGMRGEVWVTLFALGCHVNLLMYAVTSEDEEKGSGGVGALADFLAGARAHRVDAITDACAFAKQMNDITVVLYQHEEEMLVPYAILPTLLTRVRSVFDEAGARGALRVASNMRAVTSKIFAVLFKRLRTGVVEVLPALMPGESPKWMLLCKGPRDQPLVMAFAALVYECRLSDAPSTAEIASFVAAFHTNFPTALELRCPLYLSEARAVLQQPLSTTTLGIAADRLAMALTTLPTDTTGAAQRVVQVNRHTLTVTLAAVNLALGNVPADPARSKDLHVPELAVAAVALRSGSLALFDVALRRHSVFFLATNTYNVMMAARARLAVLLLVKYYMACGCESRIHVSDLVAHYGLPYTVEEAMAVWLLPLLINKHVNGVLDNGTLVMSTPMPFDDYAKEALVRAAQAEYGVAARA